MMGQDNHSQASYDGYVVRRPRVTDSLGESLRHAFGDPARLPDDIARALAALDRTTSRH